MEHCYEVIDRRLVLCLLTVEFLSLEHLLMVITLRAIPPVGFSIVFLLNPSEDAEEVGQAQTLLVPVDRFDKGLLRRANSLKVIGFDTASPNTLFRALKIRDIFYFSRFLKYSLPT